MYFKEIESSAQAKLDYNKRQRELSVERMKRVAASKKSK